MSHSFSGAAECHVCHIAAVGWASRSVAKLCRAAPRGWETFGQQILHALGCVWKLGSAKLPPHPLPTAHLQMERGWVTAMMWWRWWWKWEQTKEGVSCVTEHTDKQGQGPFVCMLGEPTCMDARCPPVPLQLPKLAAYFWWLCVQWAEVKPVSIETQGKDEAAHRRWMLSDGAFWSSIKDAGPARLYPILHGAMHAEGHSETQNALCLWWGTGLLLADPGSRAGRVVPAWSPSQSYSGHPPL